MGVNAIWPDSLALADDLLYDDDATFADDADALEFMEFLLGPYTTAPSRAIESFTLPRPTGLVPTAGTGDFDVYIDAMARRQVAGKNPTIFRLYQADDINPGLELYHESASANWTLKSYADDGSSTSATIADAAIPLGKRRLRLDWDDAAHVVRLYVDAGTTPVATIAAAKLPSGWGTNISLGGYSATTMLNAPFYGARLSSINRGADNLTDASVPLEDDDDTVGLWVFDSRITGNYRPTGTWSQVFDGKTGFKSWWKGLTLSGSAGGISYRTRSFMDMAARGVWSTGALFAPGRYLEAEITLTAQSGGADTPVLDSLELTARKRGGIQMKTAEIWEEALRHFGEDQSGKYHADGGQWGRLFVNRVYRDICRETHCARTSATLTTTANEQEIELPPDCVALERVLLRPSPGGPEYPLERVRVDESVRILSYYQATPGSIGLIPIPDRAYSLTVWYYQGPVEDLGPEDAPELIPEEWQRVMVFGVAYQLARTIHGKDAAQLTTHWYQLYQEELRTMKRYLREGCNADSYPGVL